MIKSFADKDTRRIWQGEKIYGMSLYLQENARRKLRMLNSSQDLIDLRIPPSNNLEKLKGYGKNYYSIRINDQWRIIFVWQNGNAEHVEIIDYH